MHAKTYFPQFHRETSICFIKYISTVFTLQQVAKARFVNALMNLELTKEEISALSTIPSDDMVTTNTISKKRSIDGQPKIPEEDINNYITFPAFDLSTKNSVWQIHVTVLQPPHTRLNATPITAIY